MPSDDFVGPMDAFVKHISKDEYRELSSIEFEKLHVINIAKRSTTLKREAMKNDQEREKAHLCQLKCQLIHSKLQMDLGLRDSSGKIIKKVVSHTLSCC
jgi:hypothetical protein